MYFPIGWPKVLNLCMDGSYSVRDIICNRERNFFAILSDNRLSIWLCKPCVPLVSHIRNKESLDYCGLNELIEWRPDSSIIVVSTSAGYLVFYKLSIDNSIKTLYKLIDSPNPGLKRDSDELFIKENIPLLNITPSQEINVGDRIVSIVCIRDELMISTANSHILRYRWDGTLNRDYCLDLRRIPFCIDKQVSKAIPIFEQNKYIVSLYYSPLVGGFAAVLNDGRAAFLTASSLKFDPNQVQGIWAPNIEDATCCCINHRFRLIVFGRKNSKVIIYTIDDQTGGLELSHELTISSQVYPGELGQVCCLRWTPDGCALAVSWSSGGFSVWSTFGALLACSLGWNYGLHVDLSKCNPLCITAMEWSVEGYQLWFVNQNSAPSVNTAGSTSIFQLEFLKSTLTVNPCMSHQAHLFLQGADKVYINLGSGGLTKVYQMSKSSEPVRDCVTVSSTLVESKQWVIVLLPSTYMSTNWPLRYSAIDTDGKHIAVAGRTGLAHYSMITHRWKLFGNETQEKDMTVTGGLLWWRSYVVAGCYIMPEDQDAIRIYPRESRLSNDFMTSLVVNSQILLMDSLWDKLVVFCADGQIMIYEMEINESNDTGTIRVDIKCCQTIDMQVLCIHPACVISITLTTLRSELNAEKWTNNSFVLNVGGRLLLINQQNSIHMEMRVIPSPVLLASCVENVWGPSKFKRDKPHLTEALWLFCGAHGMRVWLPLFPKDGDKTHTFISKRIMLPFKLKIYPLAILFEDAILLGAENDTILYTSNPNSVFSLPFNTIERTSQVYLHQILRQLIRRNLGYHAWEIARCCNNLPYFPHSLELLLHEVLEEEATSKEPIPDAQLPSVIEFIQEFPVYLQTIVQCARKTEIALWPYLFSTAGKPKDLFQQCLSKKQLDTAASYLIILQNLESSVTSRQYATYLLDATLEAGKWELSKDLVRFFRAIDPNDTDSRRVNAPAKLSISQSPSVQPTEVDLSFVLGSMQVTRGRSFSTATQPKVDSVSNKSVTEQSNSSGLSNRRKKSVPVFGKADKEKGQDVSVASEEFFLDTILQRHARRLLTQHNLSALGYFAAHLDFRLVEWLHRERESSARVGNFINALKHLHSGFSWPYPILLQPANSQRKLSSLSSMPSVFEERQLSNWSAQNDDISSAVGDSGYMSCQDHISAKPQEAYLQPRMIDVRSIISEGDETVWWAEEPEPSTTDSWNDIPSVQILEQLSTEVTSRGSNKSEVQLRYLLQLFMEAGCLEWALVISIVLRDVLAIHRVTNAARSLDQSYESVVRLREGFLTIFHWSSVECIGYKPLMIACQSQISVLNKLMLTKQRNTTPPPQVSPHIRSRTSSSNCDTNSQCGTATSQTQHSPSSRTVCDLSHKSQNDSDNSVTDLAKRTDDKNNQKSTSSCVIS